MTLLGYSVFIDRGVEVDSTPCLKLAEVWHMVIPFLSQVAVIEVGLGGRLDATNVHPSPLVCGVSSLGIDHTAVSVAAHRQGVK